MTLELPFTYPSLYKPPFSTLWASFAQLSFGENEESPRVRVLLVIFKRGEDLVRVFEMYFMRFGWKKFFTICDEKVCLMGFDERKSLKFDERMPCVWEMCGKFTFPYLEKFSSLHKLRWNEKSWKLKLNPLFSWKPQVKLSLLGSSHSLHS